MIRASTFIARHEGASTVVYKDIFGISTIGYGFNLQRADADDQLLRVGAPTRYELLNGAELTQEQMTKLLELDIQLCTDDLASIFANWNQLPEVIRLVLTDIRFNVGPARFRGFHNTIDSFRRGDYKDAARRLRMSLWAKQVGTRADENIALVLSVAK